jgi:hypothetical protein
MEAKEITIKIPAGKIGMQEMKEDKLIITFKDKPKGKIIDRIKTFEDACNELNMNPYIQFFASDSSDEVAYKKLKIIIQAINEGWKPNWNDSNERKWYPYFTARPSGFGFSNSTYDYWHTGTHCGSRLCIETKEKAEYIGKQFEDIYNEFLTL